MLLSFKPPQHIPKAQTHHRTPQHTPPTSDSPTQDPQPQSAPQQQTHTKKKRKPYAPLPSPRKNPHTLKPTTHLQTLPLHPSQLETRPSRGTIPKPPSLPSPRHGSSHHHEDLHRPCQQTSHTNKSYNNTQSHRHHRMDDDKKPMPPRVTMTKTKYNMKSPGPQPT